MILLLPYHTFSLFKIVNTYFITKNAWEGA